MDKPAAKLKFGILIKRLASSKALKKASPNRAAVISALYAIGRMLGGDKYIPHIRVLEGDTPSKVVTSITIPPDAQTEIKTYVENIDVLLFDDPIAADDGEAELKYFIQHCKNGKLQVLENTDIGELSKGLVALINILESNYQRAEVDGPARKYYSKVTNALSELGSVLREEFFDAYRM